MSKRYYNQHIDQAIRYIILTNVGALVVGRRVGASDLLGWELGWELVDGALLRVGYAERKGREVMLENDIMTLEIDESNNKYSKSKVTYRGCWLISKRISWFCRRTRFLRALALRYCRVRCLWALRWWCRLGGDCRIGCNACNFITVVCGSTCLLYRISTATWYIFTIITFEALEITCTIWIIITISLSYEQWSFIRNNKWKSMICIFAIEKVQDHIMPIWCCLPRILRNSQCQD